MYFPHPWPVASLTENMVSPALLLGSPRQPPAAVVVERGDTSVLVRLAPEEVDKSCHNCHRATGGSGGLKSQLLGAKWKESSRSFITRFFVRQTDG